MEKRCIANKFFDVGRLDDFEEFVGSVTGFSYDRGGGVVKSDAVAFAVVDYLIDFERLIFVVYKMVFVVVEDESLNAPVVVDEIRVKEVHAPTFFWWGEASEKEDACSFMNEWCERMTFEHIK